MEEQQEHIHLVGVYKVVKFHPCHLSSKIPSEIPSTSSSDNIYELCVCVCMCL